MFQLNIAWSDFTLDRLWFPANIYLNNVEITHGQKFCRSPVTQPHSSSPSPHPSLTKQGKNYPWTEMLLVLPLSSNPTLLSLPPPMSPLLLGEGVGGKHQDKGQGQNASWVSRLLDFSDVCNDTNIRKTRVELAKPISDNLSQNVWLIPIPIVRYHSGGSMKLNACNLLPAHMVYL